MAETQSTHNLVLVTPDGTFNMQGNLGTTSKAIFKPPNKELSFKQHAALKKMAKCAGEINSAFGPIDSMHIDKIPE
jgi:hypothetical protein